MNFSVSLTVVLLIFLFGRPAFALNYSANDRESDNVIDLRAAKLNHLRAFIYLQTCINWSNQGIVDPWNGDLITPCSSSLDFYHKMALEDCTEGPYVGTNNKQKMNVPLCDRLRYLTLHGFRKKIVGITDPEKLSQTCAKVVDLVTQKFFTVENLRDHSYEIVFKCQKTEIWQTFGPPDAVKPSLPPTGSAKPPTAFQ